MFCVERRRPVTYTLLDFSTPSCRLWLASFQVLDKCRQASFRDLVAFENEGECTVS